MAWNSIYREVREDSVAVDIWTLEILSHLMSALDLAQADDPALGTHEQTKAAILHVRRILIVKKELFWEVSLLFGEIYGALTESILNFNEIFGQLNVSQEFAKVIISYLH